MVLVNEKDIPWDGIKNRFIVFFPITSSTLKRKHQLKISSVCINRSVLSYSHLPRGYNR